MYEVLLWLSPNFKFLVVHNQLLNLALGEKLIAH